MPPAGFCSPVSGPAYCDKLRLAFVFEILRQRNASICIFLQKCRQILVCIALRFPLTASGGTGLILCVADTGAVVAGVTRLHVVIRIIGFLIPLLVGRLAVGNPICCGLLFPVCLHFTHLLLVTMRSLDA